MKNKIAVEEHFGIPETLKLLENSFDKDYWPVFSGKIRDILNSRLEAMDRFGIEKMVLSLNSPGIQAIYNKKEAVAVARKSNDFLAETIEKQPDRFLGYAAIPLQDVDEAIKEMRRAIVELGFVGVNVNGFVQIDSFDNYKYLDDERFRPFWAEAGKLDVPVYLHPRDPMPGSFRAIDNHPWLGSATWAFGVETASHALRLMASGIFDEYPYAKLILGHLGEALPFCIWRAQNHIQKKPMGIPAKKSLMEYMQQNIWFATSCQFRTAPLWNTIMEFGSDHILFAVDYPYEDIEEGCEWFDHCTISENDRVKIGRENAINLFHLHE